MADLGHMETDKRLSELERRIMREYQHASKEILKKTKEFMRQFQKEDDRMRTLVAEGKMTDSQYKKWRIENILTGRRWDKMRKTLVEDWFNADKIARRMVNDEKIDVYALNHNYAAYQIEHDIRMNTSFTLYNHESVERLLRDNPKILPPPGKKLAKDIAEGRAKRWSEKKIQSIMAQSILQGDSVPNIAKRLTHGMGEMSKNAAIRNARTLITGAEAAGRVDAYKQAKDMGIDMKQMWLAALDGRTRHEHRLLDGQKVEVDKPFKVDGVEIRFPGDPTAPGYLIYNCRCTIVGVVKGSDLDLEGLEGMERDNRLGDMSYEEWKEEKAKQGRQAEQAKVEKSTGIERLREAAQKSTDKFDFWLNLDEDQQAIFKASGMSLDDAFNSLRSNVETFEWKTPNPGGPESFRIPHDYSGNSVTFNAIKSTRGEGWMASADSAGTINVNADGITDWKFVIGHEAGHQLANYSPELQRIIVDNPGDVFGRYNMQRMFFDGVYGEYNPEEAFATCVSQYINQREHLREHYPQAYAAIEELFTASPSAFDFVNRIVSDYERMFG